MRPTFPAKLLQPMLWLLLLLPAGVLCAAMGDDLEFNGVLIDDSRTQVSLLDLQTGVARWVPVGGSFAGYTVTAYNPAKETIALSRIGLAIGLNLRLKNAIILVVPPPTPWPQPSNPQRAAVAENLRLLAAAAQQYLADTGADSVSTEDLVGPGKIIPELTPAAGESYQGMVLTNDLSNLHITTADGTTVSSDGTGLAPDGSQILADGGRVTTDGTHLAPDGAVIGRSTPGTSGPFIPPNASSQLAAALSSVGWKFRPVTTGTP